MSELPHGSMRDAIPARISFIGVCPAARMILFVTAKKPIGARSLETQLKTLPARQAIEERYDMDAFHALLADEEAERHELIGRLE